MLWLAGAAAMSLGCGGRAGSGATSPTQPGPGAGDRAFIEWLNSGARRGAVVETIHGVEVADPYRLLEQDVPTTRAWIEGQTARTEELLRPYLTAARRERLETLMSIGVLSSPEVAGDRVFYERREGGQEQPVLMVRDGAAEARVLLDPAALGPRVAMDWFYPSPDGALVALGLSRDGDERSELRLFDATSAAEARPAERIANCKWSTVSWLHDGTGFYYTRYPREGEPGYDPAEPDSYFPRIFFHRLGEDPSRDALVYGAEEREDFPSPSVSADDRWLVINVMRGWSQSDVLLLDRSAGAGARPVAVSVGCDCLVSGAVHHGRLYLHTNEGHPRYRLLAVDPAEAADRSRWVEVVPESEAILEGFTAAADRLVLYEMSQFASRVRFATLDGHPTGELALPTAGSVGGLSAQPTSSRVALDFSSFFYPPTLLVADSATGEVEQVEQVRAAAVDVSTYEVTRETVASADGTPINVFLVHRRGAARDGSNRVLLYGYGGFNISLLPTFSRSVLYWLEQGGVYALANLRGGGELGEAWHRAGQLENKVHVFEDFEAVIRWLSESGWSQPPRIGILGGSNGGLLVGATLTRCPEAFGAAVGQVGLYDMLRYHRFPPAELWVSEYGSAADPAQFAALRAYSPYHNVRPGTTYPAALIETADHDSRVFWGHSTKFAARLQEASTDPEAVLFYMDRSVGHGAGTSRSDTIDQMARMYAFLIWRLWTEGAAPGPLPAGARGGDGP
jgi:prolyl oligopeptidase